MIIELLVGVGILLIIVCLVVRDRTEYQLTRMRSGVMKLRAQEQRLVYKYKETEKLVEHTNSAFVSATHRQRSCKQGNRVFKQCLEKLYPLVKNTSLVMDDDETESD